MSNRVLSSVQRLIYFYVTDALFISIFSHIRKKRKLRVKEKDGKSVMSETVREITDRESSFKPFKDEAQTALFKDPVRTAL
jgi:hypothetical protein